MELPHIGQTCVICNRNDYLPFKCHYCEKIVCIDHKSSHGSDCPLTQTSFDANLSEKTPGESLKQACDHCKKITLKLELSECSHCKGNHCLYHRHQVQHDCVKLSEDAKQRQLDQDARARRQQEAMERLKEAQARQEASKQTVTAKFANMPRSLDPKKQALARRVRIMKIKQTAKGPPNVLDHDKLFFEVKFRHEPRSSLSNESKDGKLVSIFATRKHTVGRLVDFAADELDIPNKNHIEGSDQLIFRVDSSDGAWETLDSQKPFDFSITSGLLDSGDQLTLTYEPKS